VAEKAARGRGPTA